MQSQAIHEVAIYVTDIGAALAAKEAGSAVRRLPPKTMIPTADARLGLNGSLVSYMDGREFEPESAPEMDQAAWQEFLNRRFAGRRWQRWWGKASTALYSVVVVFDAERGHMNGHETASQSVADSSAAPSTERVSEDGSAWAPEVAGHALPVESRSRPGRFCASDAVTIRAPGERGKFSAMKMIPPLIRLLFGIPRECCSIFR